MKVKIASATYNGRGIAVEADIEIPTADLIAELEKRRPCEDCHEDKWHKCSACVFSGGQIHNNFKGSK
jgi:hypothetical protein